MARIRTIKPSFWTSEQIVELSPIARLLFVGMWNFCDDAGIMPASARTLKMQVFPGDDFTADQIGAWVAEMIQAGLIVPYEADGRPFWAVTGWHHQKIDRPNYLYPAPQFGEHSTNDRRTLTDHSPPEGRGMEGKGRDSTTSSTARVREADDFSEKNENSAAAESPLPVGGGVGGGVKNGGAGTFDRDAEIHTWPADDNLLDAFTKTRRVPRDRFEGYLLEFMTEIRALRDHPHRDREDLRRHFLSWAAIHYAAETAKPANGHPHPTRRRPSGSPNNFTPAPAGQKQPF